MLSAKGVQDLTAAGELREDQALYTSPVVAPRRPVLRRWLVQDSPYILMLLLALVGVAFHLQASYWVILTPLFGIICVVAGWRHFETQQGRLQLAITQALSWCALIFTIYILYNNIVQGVLNNSSTTLAMLALLGLGTFVAGLQARVWRICAVGVILLAAVPGMGWLEQSALFLAAGVFAVAVVGFVTWWVSQRQPRTKVVEPLAA